MIACFASAILRKRPTVRQISEFVKMEVVISKGGFLLRITYHITPIITVHHPFINRK